MPDGSINISQSKVKTWRDCRRMYYYKFVMELRRKSIKRPFMFGRLVHEMMEADLKKEDPFKLIQRIELDNKKMFAREMEMYGNIIADVSYIMTDYFDYWKGSADEFKAVKGPDGSLAEHEFRIEVGKGIWFTGKIDAVVKARNLRWIGEHKSFNRMPSEEDRWRSVQGATYFKATDLMGFKPIDGIVWDYIWSKPPSVPTEVLQSGDYSLKKINSLPSALKAWIKREKLDKSKYKKLMDEAKVNRQFYFKRIYSPIKKRTVDMIWDDFLETAHEIKESHGTKKAQTIGRHCSWCDFRDICKAEATGADMEFVIKRDFTTEPEQRTDVNDDRVED